MAEQLDFGAHIILAVQTQAEMVRNWQAQCQISPVAENFEKLQASAQALVLIMESARLLQDAAHAEQN